MKKKTKNDVKFHRILCSNILFMRSHHTELQQNVDIYYNNYIYIYLVEADILFTNAIFLATIARYKNLLEKFHEPLPRLAIV